MEEVRKKRKRRFWILPSNSARLKLGTFHLEFQELRKDECRFYEHYRMSASTFDELLQIISSKVTGQDTLMRLAVSPAEKLAVTLRYLGSGSSFTEIHNAYKISKSTIGMILREVCSAIWELLIDRCMPILTKEDWLKVAENFEKRSNFPHCIGAISCKYILTLKNASVVILAVTDAMYRFLDVHISSYEKQTNSTIFEQSPLWHSICDGTLKIPQPEPLSSANNDIRVPYVFVGDETVRFSNNILRPYTGRNLSEEKRVFNYRLERARRNAECSFAILCNKWRIFHKPLNVALDLIIDITKACCVLHNFVIEKEGYLFEDSLVVDGMYDVNVIDPTRGPKSSYVIRDYLATYFVNDGAVPWQCDVIGS